MKSCPWCNKTPPKEFIVDAKDGELELCEDCSMMYRRRKKKTSKKHDRKKNILEYKLMKFKTSDDYIVLRKDSSGYWIDYISYDINEDDAGTRHTLKPEKTLKAAMKQVRALMKGKV